VAPLAVLRGVPRDRARGILDFARFEVALTALVALVAAGFRTAVGTGSLDVAVGEILICLGVVGDLDFLLVDVALVVQRADDLLSEFGVRLVVGVAVVVEVDVEFRERLLVLFVPLQREVFRVDALLFSVDRDRRPVHVRSADVDGVLAQRLERSIERVRADVPPKVTDVQVAVGVGQPAGHDGGFVRRKLVVAHGRHVALPGVKPAGFDRSIRRPLSRVHERSAPPRARTVEVCR